MCMCYDVFAHTFWACTVPRSLNVCMQAGLREPVLVYAQCIWRQSLCWNLPESIFPLGVTI